MRINLLNKFSVISKTCLVAMVFAILLTALSANAGRGDLVMGPTLSGVSIPSESSQLTEHLLVKKAGIKCYLDSTKRVLDIMGVDYSGASITTYENHATETQMIVVNDQAFGRLTAYVNESVNTSYQSKDRELALAPDPNNIDFQITGKVNGTLLNLRIDDSPAFLYDGIVEIDHKYDSWGNFISSRKMAKGLRLTNSRPASSSPGYDEANGIEFFVNSITKQPTIAPFDREEMIDCLNDQVFNPDK